MCIRIWLCIPSAMKGLMCVQILSIEIMISPADPCAREDNDVDVGELVADMGTSVNSQEGQGVKDCQPQRRGQRGVPEEEDTIPERGHG